MRSIGFLVSTLLLLLSNPAFAAPSQLILTNQYGEVSINTNTGASLPLAGSANVVVLTGAVAPVDGTTGLNIAAKGSLYIAQSTGALYQNTGTKSAPAWAIATTSSISDVLTGFTAGSGTVASTDTILQAIQKLAGLTNYTPTLISETVAAAGAISTTTGESLVNNATGGSYAVTLAAPSSQDGQIKIIKLGTATHTVTLAMTNIKASGAYTPTGTTTLTFTSTGDCAIFMAVGTKWIYLGGSAIAS
jgi:hypothetical protein